MRAFTALCLITGVGLAAGAVAQAPSSAPDSGVPTLKVNTRLTLVDVTATDSKQKPVHGLIKPNFTLKEDDKPQAIKNFDEYGANRDATAAAGPRLPPDVYTNQQASRPVTGHAVNILLFDQVSTGISRGLQPSPEVLGLAKDAAEQYLKTMPPGTEVAVMAMDGGGLHMVQGLTSDENRLLAAVASIAYSVVPDARWDPGSGRPPCAAANFQSQQALNALNQTALFVSDVPGRKNLMWFTPGLAWLTDYPRFSNIPRCLVIDYTSQLQQVYGRLTAARVAVYPIDARGLYGNPAGEAAKGGKPVNNPIGFDNLVNDDRRALDDVATATGGKAYAGGNDLLGALREDTETGSDYYALSYVPPLSKYDGKYHTIEVKVDRPGVQLDYRRGYTSLDLNGPLEKAKSSGDAAAPKDAFQTAMSYGWQSASQVMFAVRAVPATGPLKSGVIGALNTELKSKPLVRYTFDFDLPRGKITLVQQPDGSRKGSFELAVAAYDVQGRLLNSLDEKHSFTLKADAVADFLQKPFVVPMEIDLPVGSVSVRAGVLDLPSEEMGVVAIPLNIAK